MAYGSFNADVRARKSMFGTFVKTADVSIVETLARTGLDFICLDGEHAPFDRAPLDACLAVARALGFPCLVRVPAARAEYILQALDGGAAGLVIPHVDSAAKAAEMGRLSRFGNGGRGFAGTNRGSDWGRGGMTAALKAGADPVIFVQIEEPEGVEEAEGIAAAPGIDGVFLGPADLSVGYGHDNLASDDLARAYERVGKAVAAAGRAYASYAPDAASGAALARYGVHMAFVGSDLSWLAAGAVASAAAFRG